jgi:hypothetical protein
MRIEGDFDRHALDNFGKMSGRVIGRQQREFLAAGGRHARGNAVFHLGTTF